MSTDSERRELALRTYKKYMGREHRLKSSPYDPPNITDISHLVTERCYGDSWSKTAIDMKTKSLVTMTMLVSLGNEEELKIHIAAAHHQGVTKEQIVEWLVHVNSYLGTPKSVWALRVAREVWRMMAEGK